MSDIEKTYKGWITFNATILMPKDEIKDVEIKAFQSENEELDGTYIVRVKKGNPTMELICYDEEDAKEYCDFFNKSKKVVKLRKE